MLYGQTILQERCTQDFVDIVNAYFQNEDSCRNSLAQRSEAVWHHRSTLTSLVNWTSRKMRHHVIQSVKIDSAVLSSGIRRVEYPGGLCR